MVDSRTRTILYFEIQRHRALARLTTLPQAATAHVEVAEALEKALTVLDRKDPQPKRVAVYKCSRSRLRKGERRSQNDAKTF